MRERWEPVEGFEGEYEVSNMGRVRSLDREVAHRRFGRAVTHHRKGKVLSPSADRYGYGQVYLHRRAVFVHRLVAHAFIPNPEQKITVNHKNRNKSDNRASNLEWMTHQENMKKHETL